MPPRASGFREEIAVSCGVDPTRAHPPRGRVATPAVFPRRLAGRSPRGVLRAAVGRSSGSGRGWPWPAFHLLVVASQGRAPQCNDDVRFQLPLRGSAGFPPASRF